MAAIEPVKAYAARGGDIIALNPPLWKEALLSLDGGWESRDEYQRRHAADAPDNMISRFSRDEIAVWQRGCFKPQVASVYESTDAGPAAGMPALHASIPELHGWDNFGPAQMAVPPFPNGETLTIFAAKGGARTTALGIEWREKDGSRWIASIRLTPEWRLYVLRPEDFKFWQSVPERAAGVFNPANATSVNFGLSNTHTGGAQGAQEFWVANFGSGKMRPEYQELAAPVEVPRYDILCPSYKFYDIADAGKLSFAANPHVETSVPAQFSGIHPRPTGGGFDKGRNWRWTPLLTARSEQGDWRGVVAAMMIHGEGSWKGGAWASIATGDFGWLQGESALAAIRETASRMRDGVFLLDGGTQFYTYFEDQAVTLGVRASNIAAISRTGLSAVVTVSDAAENVVHKEEWSFDLAAGETRVCAATPWLPNAWPEAGYKVRAELRRGKEVLDSVSHDIHVWRPKADKSFIATKDGEFILDGKRWRANGVNYMPSTGIATEDGRYFEQWVSAQSYDPEFIQRDLDHLHDMGINSVSFFLYHDSLAAQNMLDLLRRLDILGIKANLSLRPGTPFDFEWDKVREMIEQLRLAENDTVFAYDLAWEPMFLSHKERLRWDAAWERWVIERYGSIANAERDWGFPIPRDEAGKVTNPIVPQTDTNGPWTKMVAAYRRCLDTILYQYYGKARDLVRSVDPNHLVSFRMTEAGNPTCKWEGHIPYDFPYLAAAVDFLAPEGYGRIGDWDRVKPGWFEHEYARWAAPEKPMLWAEAGVSAWDIGSMTAPESALKFQGDYFRDLYRMFIGSAADGIYFWWYPGGFRTGENSDYGIINPDGTDRPNTGVIRELGPQLLNGPSLKPVDTWLEFDRDAHAIGIAGVYDELQEKFWQLIAEGKTPGLRTAGTGTDSASCPLLAVGNTPCDGTNPPKYLDGYFDKVEVLNAEGKWVEVENGGSVLIKKGEKPVARVTVTNLAEAAWNAGDKQGSVVITATGGETLRAPSPKSVAKHERMVIENIVLLPAHPEKDTTVVLSFDAVDRTPFGQKFPVTLKL